MTHKKTTEVTIIGTGPSGLACAKILQDARINTIVLEKNNKVGSKNNFSKVIYKEPYENIFGGLPPIQRTISEYRVYLLQDNSFTYINHRNEKGNCFSALREALMSWMAEVVENAGGSILYEKVARDLIIQGGKVCGIKTDDGEIMANVVVIAEGTNSLLTKQSGLKPGDFSPDQVFIFVEENIILPNKVIQERFNLEDNQGVAAKLFAHPYLDAPTIVYLHTNKDSISISTGILLSESIARATNINHYHEKIKNHTVIKSMITDGMVNHYSSYMLPIPKEIYPGTSQPKLFANGCLIIGGAGMFIDPFNWDLSELAVLSGKCAAQAIIQAKNTNDYSENTLSNYKVALENLSEYKTIKNQFSPKQKLAFPFFKKNKNNLLDLLYGGKNGATESDILNNLSNIVSKVKYV